MTKLHPPVVMSRENVTLTSDMEDSDKMTETPSKIYTISPSSTSVSNCDDGNQSGSESDDSYDEPLGYQDFLCDVNIEYSPGGNRSDSLGHKYCFKMKCLPYMVGRNSSALSQNNSMDGSSSDITSCDRNERNGLGILENQTLDLTSLSSMTHMDVTRQTCAFLGNSDFVPNFKHKARVALELVSAKLSQSSGYHIPPNSSLSNLTTLSENQTPVHNNSDTSSLSSHNSHSSTSFQDSRNSAIRQLKIAQPSPPPSPSSSKKFVNYTILVKTIPGLDKNPAVIERRFSDFLNLYQGLKDDVTCSRILDKYVAFPRKVYMGNFTLEKIAERSIEFTRLLNVCMIDVSLTWSAPFVSFLIDKELRDAHRLSLFGDPDDVQALIENAYYIEKKLYFRLGSQLRRTSSSSSYGLFSCRSPSLPNERSLSAFDQTISSAANRSSREAVNNTQDHSYTNDSSPRSSTSTVDSNIGSEATSIEREKLTPINQRILVTFCMLFVTYCRSQNYQSLKQAASEFSHLISSQEYVDSLINTRHYNSLRACLLFLMNLNHGSVIDDELRMLFKRKLEDIDGMHAELYDETDSALTNSRNSNTNPRGRRFSSGHDPANSPSAARVTKRVTKKDLTSLLRDRNFCLFEDCKLG